MEWRSASDVSSGVIIVLSLKLEATSSDHLNIWWGNIDKWNMKFLLNFQSNLTSLRSVLPLRPYGANWLKSLKNWPTPLHLNFEDYPTHVTP